MSIFSNLVGTMKQKFMIGKRGIKLINQNNELHVKNNAENAFVPVSVADPTSGNHAVNLSYFNAHGGGGGGGSTILWGTTDPQSGQGVDGNAYFKVDSTNIVVIYLKDQGIWKPLVVEPVNTSFSKTFDKVDWVVSGTEFTLTIPASEHLQTSALLIEMYQNTVDAATSSAPYEIAMSITTVDSSNNVVITSNAQFSGLIVISGK